MARAQKKKEKAGYTGKESNKSSKDQAKNGGNRMKTIQHP